jgi:hypothetical protein
MAAAEPKHLAEAKSSLLRIQNFEAKQIDRPEDLGRDLNFADAVAPLDRTLALFRELSLDVLPDMSTQRLNTIKQQADALYNTLQSIVTFSTSVANPKQVRDGLVQQINSSYDQHFEALHTAIAFCARRATDFARMEQEARAAIQSITDRTRELEETLRTRQEEADAVLAAIRKVAAEQGVSQQAIYFREASESHAVQAKTWLFRTVAVALGLFAFAVLAVVAHKLPWIQPVGAAESVQFAIGKALVFATIAYALALSSRNFMAHQHNVIVNKHRQNSLVTYQALVEAAADHANRDIVLSKAADSIFGSQATGFTRHDTDDGKAALSMVNVGTSALKTTSSS